ncbi:claudin-12 isoform X1 [Athene cunicularia]|nr:claudin-12 isoform X1 [Athene cunicularia]
MHLTARGRENKLNVCKNRGLSELDIVECSIPALYLFIRTAGDHRFSPFNGRDSWAGHSSLYDRSGNTFFPTSEKLLRIHLIRTHHWKQLLWVSMGCRDVHAATVLAFLSGTASVAGLLAAVLLPNWRQMRLYTFNKNERNVTVYTGLWIKCARFDGSRDCVIYDPQWYTAVDQLDLRVLQFALPLSMLTAVSALFLCLIGMCNTAFVSTVPNIKLAKCLVNSAGCHLVAGLLFLLACAICLTPSIWVIFYNNYLNRKYEPVFSFDISVFIAIASAGGLFFTSVLLFLWYCACKSLPSPFWQPLYSHAPSMHSYASQPYSARSRLSAIEIDIPVVSHAS